MSTVTLNIPPEFAYTAAAITSTFWVTAWQTIKVGHARKAAGIPYPQVYAEKAEAAASPAAQKFNCAQRAHQNTLESLTTVVAGTAIFGLTHPIAAATLCGVWSATRVLYTIGYATGDPKKRNLLGSSMIGLLSAFILVGASTYSAVQLVRAIL